MFRNSCLWDQMTHGYYLRDCRVCEESHILCLGSNVIRHHDLPTDRARHLHTSLDRHRKDYFRLLTPCNTLTDIVLLSILLSQYCFPGPAFISRTALQILVQAVIGEIRDQTRDGGWWLAVRTSQYT